MARATRFITAVIGLTAAATLAGGAAIASAHSEDDAPFVTGIQVSDYHLDSGGCHGIPLSVRFDPTGATVTGITVRLRHGATALPSVHLTPASHRSTSASGHIAFCPKHDSDLGVVTVGPSTLQYTKPDGTTDTQDNARRAEFTVDQRTTATLHAVRHKHRVVIRAKARVYDIDHHRQQYVDNLRVALQRRTHATGAWKTVGHASTGSHGVAVFHESAPHRAFYRARVAGSGHVAAAASHSVRR